MSEVELKISEMRDATDRFRRTGQLIDMSMQRIRVLIAPILPQTDTLLQSEYHTNSRHMDALMLLLREFSDKLENAGDEIQGALNKPDDGVLANRDRLAPRFGSNYAFTPVDGYDGMRPTSTNNNGDVVVPEIAEQPIDINIFVSDNNRHLYDRLIENQVQLSSHEQQLTDLIEHRQTLGEDLDALRNRMVSYDRSLNVESVPRVQVLSNDIDLIDLQIVETRATIEHLETDINAITTRLQLVAPLAEADLVAIDALENGQTAEIVVNNTYGCVNHVVTRVPIPMEMARDAHMWDDMAERYTQYGIRVGDVPLEGAIISMETDHSYADDVNGHLMYIERIDEDGGVWVTDNYHPDEAVLLSDLTDELDGENIHYLYLPWHTKA